MTARWLAALVSVAGALAAQDAAQKPSISGTVKNSVTGEPIVRAHVMVNCRQDPKTYGVLSNEKGEFTVTGLANENCVAQAERVGFVTSKGDTAPFHLVLTPTGAIMGRVLDSAGEPARGVEVTATLFGVAGNAQTDDSGQFRVGGLAPGKYRLKASPQRMSIPPEIRSDGTTEIHDSSVTQPVEVKAGEETTIEIRLVRTPIVAVSGKVVGLPAGKDAGVSVMPCCYGAGIRKDGTFTIWRMDPGKYSLRVEAGDLSSAPAEIEVAGTNVEHVELRLMPPFEVAGQMRYDDDAAREAEKPMRPGIPVPPKTLMLNSAETGFEDWGGMGQVAADDSFAVEKIRPGRYSVSVTGYPAYVKSVRAGDNETEGNILDVRNGSPGPVTLTLSSNFGEIAGVVSDANGPVKGATVLMVWGAGRRVQEADPTDENGAYHLGQVAPGSYKLVAVAGPVQFTGSLKAEDLGDDAETVELRAGEKATKDLKLRQ